MELEDLIEETDIVDYISQFVELEERNGEFWGLSPFKEENTPSFSVRRESKQFYDFSSGIGGNVFTFIKKYNNCSAQEAVNILKKYIGCEAIDVSQRQKLSAAVSCRKFRPPKTFHKKSASTVYSKNYMERFEKRADKLAVWLDEGISKESLERFEIRYDGFSNRLVYPIRNIKGEIVNIGGRTLDSNWKEKKLRKYTYFSGWNGEMDVIYGLYENLQYILDKKEIIIFEGCKSVLLADSWGVRNTGALLTSHLNPNQMKILARLSARTVFALDKDVRVRDDRNADKLKRYTAVEYFWDREDLLEEKDSPVDKGKEVFEKLYEQRMRLR